MSCNLKYFILVLNINSVFFLTECNAQEIKLPEWKEPLGVESSDLKLGFGETDRAGWGAYSPNERAFFNKALPAFFKKTLVLDSITGDRGIKWIFTGPREGFCIELQGKKLLFKRQYYDSFGFNISKKNVQRYPQFDYGLVEITTKNLIKAITVELNHKLQLLVSLNGKEVIHQKIIEDIRRHQIHLTGEKGTLAARILIPETLMGKISVNQENTFQQILGWGGIGTPTAFQELSEEGKELWWKYISEYNLLCQREYPVGRLLNKNLDNWDDLKYAKAHYYGDNFPNGEVSDFVYNRKIQELGGFVIFEFWDFPWWIGDDEKEYARAMVGYCKEAVKQTGKAPRIVGVQNEINMPEERLLRFVPELRETLDREGFKDVKIHMANASTINAALERVNKFTENQEVWDCIDYSATNMYDYQLCFDDPDRFDPTLIAWDEKVNSRQFLSTELCINNNKYQTDSYRIAFTMGQLYEKNLVINNASLIAYCWTILNTEQPSFGASRSLFVVSPEDGFIPIPSGNQLRVFGAFSRRVKEGMVRVEAKSSIDDLKVVAFKKDDSHVTIVILNRSLNPVHLEIDWEGINFSEFETVDPYNPNISKQFEGNSVKIEPGSIVTITNVSLNK